MWLGKAIHAVFFQQISTLQHNIELLWLEIKLTDERDLDPQTVLEALKSGKVVLVDVREPAEFAGERIRGAVLHPLSSFEPSSIPTDSSRRIVFQCAAGGRSRKALDAFMATTGADAAHLAGGLGAWKQAGIPVVRADPATGEIIESGNSLITFLVTERAKKAKGSLS